MLPARSSDDLARLRARHSSIRNDLAGLCLHIAAVEDGLAGTFDEIARTATQERARRLHSLASDARQHAAAERARAEDYAG